MLAYPGGIRTIKKSFEWRKLCFDILGHDQPSTETDEARVLTSFLRLQHPLQAAKLPFASWPSDEGPIFLIEDGEIRQKFGHMAGKIAESHWWSSDKVAREFE
jgi:hypothetical protein